MWAEYKRSPNLMMAEMWKDILEGEGLPIRLFPVQGIAAWAEQTPFRIMAPHGREHVADEILRKL